MDSDSVAIFLPEESERKRQSCRPGRRFFCILALVAFFTLTILFGITLGLTVNNTNKYESLRKQYDNLDNDNDGEENYTASNLALIDKKINDSEFKWRRKISGRLEVVDNRLRIQHKHDENYRSFTNKSFENITNYLDNLTVAVDNLMSSLSKVNASSDEKIANLRKTLKDIKGDLGQTRTALKRVNGSVRRDLMQISKSLNVSVIDLKKAFESFSSLSTKKIKKLLDSWNKTDTEFKQSLEQISHHQNATLHLVVEHKSNALSSEIIKIKKNFSLFTHNNAIAMGKNKEFLQQVLNETRRNLTEAFQKEISRSETSLNARIGSVEKQLNLSLANVETRIAAVKNQSQTSVNNLQKEQTSTKDDLSKTKLNLQGVDDKLKTNISALVVKIQNFKITKLSDDLNDEKIKRQKVEKDLQELRVIVDKLQNTASRTWEVYTYLITFLVSLICLNI